MKPSTQKDYNRLSLFYYIFSWILFLWALHTICLLGFATLKFGHLPQYGLDPDPTASGLLPHTLTNTLLYFFALLSFIGCTIVLVSLYWSRKRFKGFSFKPLVLYLIGYAILYILKFNMRPQALWIVD